MIPEAHPTVSLHNVSETVQAAWADDAESLRRVPTAIAESYSTRATQGWR